MDHMDFEEALQEILEKRTTRHYNRSISGRRGERQSILMEC